MQLHGNEERACIRLQPFWQSLAASTGKRANLLLHPYL